MELETNERKTRPRSVNWIRWKENKWTDIRGCENNDDEWGAALQQINQLSGRAIVEKRDGRGQTKTQQNTN